MNDDLLTLLPPQRDLPSGELPRRQRHLVSEARAELDDEHSSERTALSGSAARRVLKISLVAALAALTLAFPARGVVREVASFFAGWHDPEAPVPAAPDVVIASGVARVPWKFVATTSDQGLCLGLLHEDPIDGWAGHAGCGPTDVRGDPWAVGDPVHWVQADNGSGGAAALDRIFVEGVAAEEVMSVDLVLTNGRTLQANLVERPEGIDAPLNFYWAALGPLEGVVLGPNGGVVEPQEPLVKTIIARDAAGTVLEQRDVYDPAS
jgi:hypothetical protein